VIRYINCFRKLPDMSIEDFRDYWQGAEFGDLVRRVATLTGARRYNRSLTLQVSMAEHLLSDRGLAPPYDGIVEFYWDNANHLASVYETKEAVALTQQMQRYQSQFIDVANSTAFFTEHQE